MTGAAAELPELIVEGRTWVFPEHDINTDLLMPASVFGKPLDVQTKAVLENLRPGWSALVGQGDILVAGSNFGTGSGRPAAHLLRSLGIRAVIADSVNDLFFRNAINAGLPVVVAPGATSAISEGVSIVVDVRTGIVTRSSTQEQMAAGSGLPAFLCAIIERGGLLNALREDGYIE